MKTALYLRVSTTDQSFDNQMPALEAYALAHGMEITGVYSEEATAWKAGHQKELSRFLTDIKSGQRKYDVLLIWALDRLTRQGAAGILNLINTIKHYDCKVISIQESWTELPGELGEVLFAIAGWVARMESQRRSERTKAGMVIARQNGKPIGKRGKDKKQRHRSGYMLRYAGRE